MFLFLHFELRSDPESGRNPTFYSLGSGSTEEKKSGSGPAEEKKIRIRFQGIKCRMFIPVLKELDPQSLLTTQRNYYRLYGKRKLKFVVNRSSGSESRRRECATWWEAGTSTVSTPLLKGSLLIYELPTGYLVEYSSINDYVRNWTGVGI